MSKREDLWEVDPITGISRRADGLYLVCPRRAEEMWLLYWPVAGSSPVHIDPVRRDLRSSVEVMAYVDAQWPIVPES